MTLIERIRRDCEDAKRAHGRGMTVGLPRVTLDVSQVERLLAHCEAMQARLDAAGGGKGPDASAPDPS